MTSTQSVILAKLDNLQNCLNRIEEKKPFTAEHLKSNLDLQDVISLNLQRAIQLCVDIASFVISNSSNKAPETMADAFTVLQGAGTLPKDLAESLRKAVGLRNILVHEYAKIDWAIVHAVATEHIGLFKAFSKQVIKHEKLG